MKKSWIACILLIVSAASYFLISGDGTVTNSDTPGEVILCFGDSLTYGTGAAEHMSYPAQLSRMIGRPVINSGVPGDTTKKALQRLQADVLDHEPDIVLITLGGNDLKNGVPKTEAFDNLKTIVQGIQSQGALVVLAGIDLPFYGKDYGSGYRQLAKETGSVLIPNIFKGIMGKKNLMSDPIHPNDKGYTIVAEKFYRAVSPYLNTD